MAARKSKPTPALPDGARELIFADELAAPTPIPAAAPTILCCTACGAEAEARCQCNVPYVPKSVLAEAAIIANPELSDRALAEKIKVSKNTIARARASTGPRGPVAGKRIGRDGKARSMPAARARDAVIMAAARVRRFAAICNEILRDADTIDNIDTLQEVFNAAYQRAARRITRKLRS
jgi:hypothetical protein